MFQPWVYQVCLQKRQGLHTLVEMVVKVCDGAVLPRGSGKDFRKIFGIQVAAGVGLKIVLAHDIH